MTTFESVEDAVKQAREALWDDDKMKHRQRILEWIHSRCYAIPVKVSVKRMEKK